MAAGRSAMMVAPGEGKVVKEFGGSGVTCWRRLRDWQRAGIWHMLRLVLLDKLGRLGLIDCSRASLDSASVSAKKEARRPVPTP